MVFHRSLSRAAVAVVMVIALSAACHTTASADPWPNWNAVVQEPGYTVSVSEMSGYYQYSVAVSPGADWEDFRAFAVYSTWTGSPTKSGQVPRYGYAADPLNSSQLLANDPGFYDTNGGFEFNKVPDADSSAAFGWMGDWTPLTSPLLQHSGGTTSFVFRSNKAALPWQAKGWDQTRFSLHVRKYDAQRQAYTYWVANAKNPSQPPPPNVPEPGSIGLVASGLLGLAALTRRGWRRPGG